jgi:hypothetical protein
MGFPWATESTEILQGTYCLDLRYFSTSSSLPFRESEKDDLVSSHSYIRCGVVTYVNKLATREWH